MTAYINKLKDVNSNQQLPVTHERAVRDDNGTTAETKFQNLEGAMDKAYVANSDNGMGRITLHKNMVSGVNTLTQSMMQATNTIYVIKYDFTLTSDVTIPANCVLEFDGGSIYGEHAFTGNKTVLKAPITKIFDKELTLVGSWNSSEVYSEWFGAIGDGTTDCSDAIQVAMEFAQSCAAPLHFNKGTYKVTKTLDYRGCILQGSGVKEYEPKITKDFDGHLFANISGGVTRGFRIHDISFDGLGHSGSFVRCSENENDRISPMDIRECSFYNSITDAAIYIKHCYSGTIDDCLFAGVAKGIEANYSVNCITVRDCNFLQLTDYGIYIGGECYSWNIARDIFQGMPVAISINGVNGCNITACYTEYIGDENNAVIEVNACNGLVISGCQMSGQSVDDRLNVVKRAILLNGGLNIAIFGNRISNAMCASGVAPIYSNAENVIVGDGYEVENAKLYVLTKRLCPLTGVGDEISNAGQHLMGDKIFRKDYAWRDYFLDELTWDGKSWKKVGTYFGNALRTSYPNVAALPVVSSDFTNSYYAYQGYRAFVEDIKRGVLYNGSKWVDEDGFTPKRKKGTTAQRPSIHPAEGAENMYEYYDETLGKKIIMDVVYGNETLYTYVRRGNYDNFLENNIFTEGGDYTIQAQASGAKIIAFAKNNTDTNLDDMIIIYQGSSVPVIPLIAPNPNVYPYIYIKCDRLTAEDYFPVWWKSITAQWIDATGATV